MPRGKHSHLLCIGFVNDFLNLTPKTKETKAKIKQVRLHQTKKLCTAKETINKMKRQPTEWGRKYLQITPDKGLISKKYVWKLPKCPSTDKWLQKIYMNTYTYT